MSEHAAGFDKGYAEASAPRDAEIADLRAKLDTERELRQAAESYIATIPAMCKGDFSAPCALHVRAPIEELFNRIEKLRKLFDAARSYELILVDHRTDRFLGRLKLPADAEMADCDPANKDDPRLKKLAEVCRRSNEVVHAEGALIAALLECDPTFKEAFWKCTTKAKSDAMATKVHP